jgi:hypothetical protein
MKTLTRGTVWLVSLTILALLVVHSAASAQVGPTLEPGVRVRATGPCTSSAGGVHDLSCRLKGRVLEIGPDTLVLESDGRSTVRYNLGTIDRLEISSGSGTQARRGTVAGVIVGGIATYFTLFTGGSTAICDQDANQDAAGSVACLGILALGGLAGGTLGALVGSLIPTEARNELPVPTAKLSVSSE